jgi:hypothetical protein
MLKLISALGHNHGLQASGVLNETDTLNYDFSPQENILKPINALYYNELMGS